MAARLPAGADEAPALHQSILSIDPTGSGKGGVLHGVLRVRRASRGISTRAVFRTTRAGPLARGPRLGQVRPHAGPWLRPRRLDRAVAAIRERGDHRAPRMGDARGALAGHSRGPASGLRPARGALSAARPRATRAP